jgi:hypothetical protein
MMRWRAWRRNILRYAKISFGIMGVFVILLLATGMVALPLPEEIRPIISGVIFFLLLFSAAAFLIISVAFVVFSVWGNDIERASIGRFLTDPAIPYDERRRAVNLVTEARFHPATEEEKIWYNLVLQHWQDLHGYGTRVIQPLLSLLQSERLSPGETGRVSSAVDHLAHLVRSIGEAGIEALMKAVKEGDERLMANAALILGELGEKSAVVPLIHLVSSDVYRHNLTLRINSAFALGRFQDRRVVRPLLGLLDSSNEALRRTAAQALRSQGREILMAGWKDEVDPKLQGRLRQILGSIE